MDALDLRIDGALGSHACGLHPDNDELEVNATVTLIDEHTVQLDTCPPNADCAGTFSQLHVNAPVFADGQPTGVFVTVRAAWLGKPGGPCDQYLELRNLPSWNGAQNPLAGWGDMVWFYAQDGQDQEAPDLPFTVGWTSLACSQSAYELGLFTFTATNTMNQVTLSEGNAAGMNFVLASKTGYSLIFHDVRSAQQLGAPDYSFWAIGTPLKL